MHMELRSSDENCRYIAAPGTGGDQHTPFGSFLAKHGVTLPGGLDLAEMVKRGWVRPALRVALPKEAFEAWTNFPVISPIEAEGVPEEHQWAINLYVVAMSSVRPNSCKDWWVCYLDDDSDGLAQAARRGAINPERSESLPSPFRHPRMNQEVRPWIDYFSYWQAFQIAEYASVMTGTYSLTDAVPLDRDQVEQTRTHCVKLNHQLLRHKWNERSRTFEWLSRMRTVLGASVHRTPSEEELDHALRRVAASLELDVEKMGQDVRDVLLRMWRDWNQTPPSSARIAAPMRQLLREEIQYAVYCIERIGGKPVDFLDEVWSPPAGHGLSARLIDALPREEDLARRDFPRQAEMYLHRLRGVLPASSPLDHVSLRSLLSKHWATSRSLRRFVLAFRRLHEELHAGRLTAEDRILRHAERIEQFNLTMMHAERVLSDLHRADSGGAKYPEVRKTLKRSLNVVLSHWTLTTGGFSERAQDQLKTALSEHAQLHDLNATEGLPLVRVSDVDTGVVAADHVIAAFVNLIVARNYAAHHDLLDFELVFETGGSPDERPGYVAIHSALVAVLLVLSVTQQTPSRPACGSP